MLLRCSGNPLRVKPPFRRAAKQKEKPHRSHLLLLSGNRADDMSQKMANGSSRYKNKLFDSLKCDDGSEVEPSYKMFLEHFSEDGNNYVSYGPDGDHGMPASARCEEDDDISYAVAMDEDCTNGPNRSLYKNWCGPNTKRPGVTSGRDARINVKEMDTSIDESYAAFLSLMKIEHSFMVVEPEPGVTIVHEQEDERPALKEITTSIDESYAAFLSLKKIGHSFMVVEPEPELGVTIVHEEEDVTPAGYDEMRTISSTKDRKRSMNALENMVEDRLRKTSKIISELGINGPALDNFHTEDLICTDEHGFVPYTESSAFNVYEYDQGEPIAFSSGVPSTFDEKLDSALSQPYDRNEYELLLKKATDRKPVSRQRILRSASKHYATERVGLSYLDHYRDLAEQIYSAGTDEGRLNLLRKFFFWLKNLSHEGAHRPWVSSKGLPCDPILADD